MVLYLNTFARKFATLSTLQMHHIFFWEMIFEEFIQLHSCQKVNRSRKTSDTEENTHVTYSILERSSVLFSFAR